MLKDIIGYDGVYTIDENGIIRSKDRIVDGRGDSKRLVKGKIISPYKRDNYLTIKLSLGNGKGKGVKAHKIHILLAQHFIPNPNNLPIVRHLNDVRTDNRLENLAWGTISDNTQDRIKNGIGIGEKAFRAILTNEQVKDIKISLQNNISVKELSNKYNVSSALIRQIKYNKSWKSVII